MCYFISIDSSVFSNLVYKVSCNFLNFTLSIKELFGNKKMILPKFHWNSFSQMSTFCTENCFQYLISEDGRVAKDWNTKKTYWKGIHSRLLYFPYFFLRLNNRHRPQQMSAHSTVQQKLTTPMIRTLLVWTFAMTGALTKGCEVVGMIGLKENELNWKIVLFQTWIFYL